MNAYIKIRAALEWGEGPIFVEALAALAELERAASGPVAWMWNDELGIPHASAGSKKPVWLESSASAEYIKQANLRPLYATPPAPVAEIREPTPEECRRIENQFILMNMRLETSPGRDVFDSVRAVMFPQKSEVGL